MMQQPRMVLPENITLNGRYLIKDTIGTGGFGVTYKAYDQKLEGFCSIKEFFPRSIAIRDKDGVNLRTVSDDKSGIFCHGMDRFIEEAEILLKLNVLESVVDVYDFFYENQTAYFVMEYLDGINLFELTKIAGGKLPLNIVLEIVKSIGLALVGVHKCDIFHRDISPDNIFITYDGAIKLIDFGNAKNIIRNAGEKLSVVLKPGFAPFEQYTDNGNQGTYTDVFSLAATMYYILTGNKLPDVLELNSEGYKKLDEYGIADYISNAVDNALKFDYRERTQTVIKFLSDLRLVTTEEILDVQKSISLKEDRTKPVKKLPFLDIYINSRPGGHYSLPVNVSVTVGRSANQSTIILNENYVSKKHCDIYFDGNTDLFYITDYSTNGVYVDGNKLQYNVSTPVNAGCMLAIGCYDCTIRVGVNYE
jgi:serine/threonine protein kinase